jgi:hypothetical protein
VPQVCDHLKSQGLPEKAVLLIDNAPSHPNENLVFLEVFFNIRCHIEISTAWDTVKPSILKNSWKKLKPSITNEDDEIHGFTGFSKNYKTG